MSPLRAVLAALALIAATAPAVSGGDADALFINMTTDDPHRALMAISFGSAQLDRGHPLTIFLNDRGVFVGARDQADRFPELQQASAGVIAKGGAVIACPMCIRHSGIEPADLLPGVQVGNPDLTGAALFRDGTRTLTW